MLSRCFHGAFTKDYIRHSGADLVLLQEVLSVSMLDSLMLHLSDDFDSAYLPAHPRAFAKVLWALFLSLVAAMQGFFIELFLLALQTPGSSYLSCFMLCLLSMSLALRWRSSIPAHFLLGDISGQLVVLRRKGSVMGEMEVESFDPFDAMGLSSTRPLQGIDFNIMSIDFMCFHVFSPALRSWLGVFFNLRPRGVLRVSVPLNVAGRATCIESKRERESR